MRRTSPWSARLVERGRRRLDTQLDGLAQELQPRVLLQRARQQARLAQHLEPVADPDDGAAAPRVLARPRPSPARSVRSRRCGDSRRARTRRVRRPRRHPWSSRHRATAARRPPPSCFDRAADIELAVRAREQDDTDARAHEIVDLVGLDHRVGEQSLAHLLHLRAARSRHRARRRSSRIVLPMCTCDTFV